MKKYIKPSVHIESILEDLNMICTSIETSKKEGVQTGKSLGDDFGDEDVSYSKRVNFYEERTDW